MAVKVKKPLERHKGSTVDTGKGLTEQSHKNETDMNYILRDYARTGYVKHAKQHEGKYDDISVQDFQEAMFTVTQAQQMFDALPAQVRKQFGQSPSEFLGYVQDPANAQQLADLGIIRGNDGVDINGALTGAPTEAPSPPEDPAPAGGA